MRVGTEPSPSRSSRWLRLYPRDWRLRYEDELAAVIGARPTDWRVRLDLVRGAIDAHLHPRIPPSVGVLAPLVAGGAWISAGAATLIEPVPPDWPGYLVWTLPLGLIGAVAALRIILAVGKRSGLRAPAATGPVLVVAVVGHVIWIVALALALVGGPYGAITAAAQSIAAVGTVGVGLVRWRVGDHPIAEAVLVAGGALLVPTPAAWIVVGAAWLAAALTARSRVDLRPA
jgi:hypothetical protein